MQRSPAAVVRVVHVRAAGKQSLNQRQTHVAVRLCRGTHSQFKSVLPFVPRFCASRGLRRSSAFSAATSPDSRSRNAARKGFGRLHARI